MSHKATIKAYFPPPDDDRGDPILAPWQMAAMIRQEGCVQCGRPETERRWGWPCCGSRPCRKQLSVIRLSYAVAARFRKVPVEQLVRWRKENLAAVCNEGLGPANNTA